MRPARRNILASRESPSSLQESSRGVERCVWQRQTSLARLTHPFVASLSPAEPSSPLEFLHGTPLTPYGRRRDGLTTGGGRTELCHRFSVRHGAAASPFVIIGAKHRYAKCNNESMNDGGAFASSGQMLRILTIHQLTRYLTLLHGKAGLGVTASRAILS